MVDTQAPKSETPEASGTPSLIHKSPQPGLLIDGWIWTLENDTKEADWFWENRKRTSREEMVQFMLVHGRKRNQFTPMWDTRRCKVPLPGTANEQVLQKEQTSQEEQTPAESTTTDASAIECASNATQIKATTE